MNNFYLSYQDIKHQIKQLREFEEMTQSIPEETREIRKERLDKYKRRIRKDIRLIMKASEVSEACEELQFDLSCEYGGRTVTFYKVHAPSREYMHDFINNEIRKIDSPYDCSGQWFTTDIRFAHMHDDVYLVKHSLSQDV